jgi:hypothetical protein
MCLIKDVCMIKIDNTLLQEIGLDGLPQQEKDSLLKHIYETLEMRVGMRLADQMTNQQLDEFERYFEAKDDAGAFKWLETNFPNYKDVVQEEFDKLKLEVQQAAPQILSAATTNAAAQPAIQPPQSGQQQQAYVDPNLATQPPAPAAQAPNPMVPPAQPAQPYPPQPAAFGAPAPATPQPFAPAAPAPSPQDWTQQPQQPYANPQPLAQDNQAAPQPPQPQPYPDPSQSATQPPADPYASPQQPGFPTQQPPPGYSS